MCQPPEGERRSKRATARWYEAQEERRRREGGGGAWRGPSGWEGPSGWRRFQPSEGLRLLLSGQLAAWAWWVLVDLDRHEPGCRWRRLVAGGTGR